MKLILVTIRVRSVMDYAKIYASSENLQLTEQRQPKDLIVEHPLLNTYSIEPQPSFED